MRTNNPATQDKILKAGLAEFASKGLEGARTEAIARRAGVNKRMLFYYFGSKAGLYREVLRRKLAERASVLNATPEDLTSAFTHWSDGAAKDPEWVRFLLWETLGSKGRAIASDERRELYGLVLQMFRRWMKQGRLPSDVDPAQLMLAVAAIAIFPLAFPQLVQLVTGLSPENPGFKRSRHEFFEWLSRRLSVCEPPSRALTAPAASEPADASANGRQKGRRR